jgi:hypothetical protein
VQVPPANAPAPLNYVAPYAPPSPYGFPQQQPQGNQPPRPYGSGPETHQHMPATAHQHPGGFNNGIGYAAPPNGPGNEGEEGQNEEQMLHHHLNQAAEYARRIATRAGLPARYEPAPSDSPFPPQQQQGMPMQPPGQPADPYARQPQRSNGYYAAATAPVAAPAIGGPLPAARTISGLPVGYQMELDKLNYQLNEQNRAMQVLLYERDQADTDWCVSEIRRLAAVGYQVGDYEVNELKGKPREHRGAYLQHITTKYSRVGTEPLPPMMGDPTAQLFPQMQENRPATQDEMEAALKIQAQHRIPYPEALSYARQGRVPTQYGQGPPPGFDRSGELPAFSMDQLQPSPNGHA